MRPRRRTVASAEQQSEIEDGRERAADREQGWREVLTEAVAIGCSPEAHADTDEEDEELQADEAGETELRNDTPQKEVPFGESWNEPHERDRRDDVADAVGGDGEQPQPGELALVEGSLTEVERREAHYLPV
jgi:hypothetical protein